MMRYNPQDARECIDEGEYDAGLIKVEETKSKKSMPMIVLYWQVLAGGQDVTIKDFIVNPSGLWKLKMLARAWGELDAFEDGTFDPSEHLQQAVRVELTVQKDPQYPDRNQIKAYKVPPSGPRETRVREASAEDIPF